MNKPIRLLVRVLTVIIIPGILLVSCSPKDSDIQAAIEAKKKEMPEASAAIVTVEKGVVTLSGEFKDEAAKSSFESTVKTIKGVKEVINNGTLTPPPPPPAPVVIAADDPLTKSVADATKDYPGVKATVKDGVVTLTGEIHKAALTRLMMSLHTLKPKKIDNQLTIK
ncbi:BON domain-containing protein [Flavitalea flava]